MLSMPACANSARLYQNPSTPMLNGSPYVRPSSCHPAAEPPMSSSSEPTSSVRSSRTPAATCSPICPPPHCWKMSGNSPVVSASASLALSSSFWMGTFSMVTFGWSASNPRATRSK